MMRQRQGFGWRTLRRECNVRADIVADLIQVRLHVGNCYSLVSRQFAVENCVQVSELMATKARSRKEYDRYQSICDEHRGGQTP